MKLPIKQAIPLPVIQSLSSVPPPGDEVFWDITKHGVTQGVLALWASCPQKANLRVRQGLGPKPSGGASALAFGDIFHRALDHFYSMSKDNLLQAGVLETDTDYIVDDVLDLIHDIDKERLRAALMPPTAYSQLEFMVGQAKVMLKEYLKRWRTDFAEFNWVDLERVFEVPYKLHFEHCRAGDIDVDIPVRGKYDGVFRDPKGKLWLFETKTKSYIDDAVISDKLNYDLQVMLYLWSIRTVYGENPQGVIYNIVKRPQLRQKVKESLPEFLQRTAEDVRESPDKYFVRYTATILKEELDEWVQHDLVGMMEQIFVWANGEYNYRNTGSCQQWNRPCEFLSVCAYGDKSRLERRPHVFPELEPPGD